MSSTEQRASEIKRTDLQRHDLGVPGREVVQNRVDTSTEVPAFVHKHPCEGLVYVLEVRCSIRSRTTHRRRSTVDKAKPLIVLVE